jgi:hypothetical protein
VARALRPLSSYPQRVVKKIWKIAPYDKTVIYSTRKSSPARLTILENGRKEIFATKIKRDHPGHYVIAGRWLVLETRPRAAEADRRRAAEERAIEAARLAAVAKAEAKPVYKSFIRRLTKELGPPRKAEACNRKHLAFKAPDDARCAELIAEARTSGASATLFYAQWGRELRVVAGSPAPLFALFNWNAWGPGDGGTLEEAVTALDRAAGVTLDYVDFMGDVFSLSLDRSLRKIPFEAVLADRLHCQVEWLREDFPNKRLVYGERPAKWKKLTSLIEDPGTEDYGDDE